MRLLSAAADEVKALNSAGNNSSTASSDQPAAVAAAGSRSDASRTSETMSSSSYTPTGRMAAPTQKTAIKKDPHVAKPEKTIMTLYETHSASYRLSRSAMRLAERRGIFRSSDESNDPSPRRSRFLDSA